MAAAEPFSFDFTGEGAPEVFYASLATEGFFEVLGAGAALGRTSFRRSSSRAAASSC